MNTLHVISFPKSGRTWLRVMLDDIGQEARYSHDESDHAFRRPFADLREDKSRYAGKPVLLMVRDPRDTVVSGYFQVTRRLRIEAGPLSELIRDHRHGIEKICRFHLQWFAAAHQINRFAILRYEDMHKFPSKSLSAVVAFAGKSVDDKTAELVASDRTFERMRAAEASGELARRYGGLLLPGNFNDDESFKVRRGVVGGYTNYLSKFDLAYCEEILAATGYWLHLQTALSRWGLRMPSSDHPLVSGADGNTLLSG